MFYDYSFTVPAGRAKATPYEQEIYLPPGIMHRIEAGFPGGCVGMVHLVIRHGLNQLWPTNADGSWNGNRTTIVINEHHKIDTEPFILTLVGWSPDTGYDHTLEVRFGILPEEILMPEESFMRAFKKLLTRLRV